MVLLNSLGVSSTSPYVYTKEFCTNVLFKRVFNKYQNYLLFSIICWHVAVIVGRKKEQLLALGIHLLLFFDTWATQHLGTDMPTSLLQLCVLFHLEKHTRPNDLSTPVLEWSLLLQGLSLLSRDDCRYLNLSLDLIVTVPHWGFPVNHS